MPDTPQPTPTNSAGDPGPVVEPSSGPSEIVRPPSNLPHPLSSFVGRGREMAEVEGLLAENRLLTLTGPGGSGKTRLALAVAREVVGDYEDGTWLVELAPLSEPGLVAQAVASVLGVREAPGDTLTDTLVGHLEGKSMLLVLDNCEHLVGASTSLAEALLVRCPNLRILATSRGALGVEGETLFAVPPLTLPDPHRLSDMQSLARYEATKLFVERARAVRPNFSLARDNVLAVSQICYRLDGIPLAIELAAARTRVLSAEQISSRLDDSFRLLTGSGRMAIARQRTLRATMDWSHGLLGPREKELFRRLSVFAGWFSLGAAEAVCAGKGLEPGEVLDPLASLVDKSLVLVAERDGEVRYRLLETTRQYTSEKLAESDEAGLVRRRHAHYYLALAEGSGTEPGEQGAWLRRLEDEQSNFRAALGWALGTEQGETEGGPEERAAVGLRLAVALGQGRFWAANGLSEGLRWLEVGLAKSGDTLPPSVRAAALNEAGWIATVQGDGEKAVVLLEESFALSKELGDSSGVAASLVQLGQLLAMSDGDPARMAALREEAETLRSEPLEPSQAAYLVMFRAMASWHGRDDEAALELFGEGLGLFRDLGNLQGATFCLGSLGFLRLGRDGPARAAEHFDEALHNLVTLRDRVGMYHCLLGAGSVAALREEPDHAARLWGAAEALGETAKVPLVPLIRARYDYDGHVAITRWRLGEEALEAAWTEGRKMTPEQAVEFALRTLEASEDTEVPPAYPAGLSAREVEVLRLLARGMTNAQIAKELFISPRTVNGHLGSAYRKVGSNTRVEATRFVTEHGLL